MAEKIVIAEVDINMEKALSDTLELKKRQGALRAEMKLVKDTVGEASVEYIQLNAEYKAVNTQLRSHETILQKVKETNEATTGSIRQMEAQLSVLDKQWKKLSEEERINTEEGKKLAAQKLALSQALNQEKLATGDSTFNIGRYRESLEGLPGPIGNVASGVTGLGKTFKALLANPLILFIAAIVAGLTGLVKLFKSTDSGATTMAATMESVKAILDVLRQRAITLTNAFKDLFSGNFKKAGEEFKEVVAGIGKQLDEAAKSGAAYQRMLDSIEDSENNYISRSAELKNAIAKLEYTAADKTKSAQVRKEAIQQAIALSEDEAAKMVEIAKKKLDAEAAYLAERSGLRKEDVIGFIRMTDEEQENASQSLKTLRNNNEDKFKDIEQLYANWINADTAFYEENKRNVAKNASVLEELKREAAEAEEERLRQQAEAAVQVMRDDLDAFLAMADEKKGVTEQLNNEIADLNETFRANEAEALRLDWENEQAYLETTLFGQFDIEQAALERSKQAELANAEKVGASKLLIEKKYAAAEKKIELAKRDAKLSLAQGAAQDLATIFGETTAVGKAAAVAATTIDTFRSATAAYTGMVSAIPGPVGIAAGVLAAGASVAMGIANVKKILSVKTDGSAGGGADSGGGSPTVATSVPTQQMVSTQTSVGNGIVSRGTVTGEESASQVNTVLVVDDVTNAQKSESEKNRTSTL